MTTPAPQTANDLLFAGGGAPALQWAHPDTQQDFAVGTTYEGEVVKTSAVRQRDLQDKSKLAVWPDGSPKYVAIVTLQTTLHDPKLEADDGMRSLWVSGKYLTNAVKDAVKRTGSREIEEGGHLKVTLSGYGKPQTGFRPPRLFDVVYTRPTPEKQAELAARKAAAEAQSQQAWGFGAADPSDPWSQPQNPFPAAASDPWGVGQPLPQGQQQTPLPGQPMPSYDQGGYLPSPTLAKNTSGAPINVQPATQYEGATPEAQALIQRMQAKQQGGTAK